MSKISFRIKYQRWMIEARVSKRDSRVKAVPKFDINISNFSISHFFTSYLQSSSTPDWVIHGLKCGKKGSIML